MNRFNLGTLLFVLLFVTVIEQVYSQDISEILNKRLEEYKKNAPSERVFLINDKDVYAPGEIIWLEALIYDISRTILSDQSELMNVIVNNSEGMEILMKEFKLVDGTSKGFIKLPDSIEDGLYYLSGYTSRSDKIAEYGKRFVIRNKIVPPFVIEVDFPDKYYKPGDELSLNISFKDFYNEPKKNIEYELSLYDGDKRARIYNGNIKKGGQIAQAIKIPADIRSGMLSYKIVADCKGISSEIAGVIPVITEDVIVEFYPLSGGIIGGFENTINIYVYDGTGQPLKMNGTLLADGEKILAVETNERGMGSFVLNPLPGKKYQLQVNDPVMLETFYDLPKGKTNGAILDLVKRNENSLDFSIKSNYEKSIPAFLIGVAGNEIFWTSEHSLQGDVTVQVDPKSAIDEIGHFILINSDAEIEAEYITNIKAISPYKFNPDINNNNPTSNSKVEVSSQKHDQEGCYIFSSANEPWMAPQLDNPKVHILHLPYDIVLSSAFQQPGFLRSNFGSSDIQEYIKYYIPYGFGWDRILNTDGAFKMEGNTKKVNDNREKYYEIIAQSNITSQSGKIVQSNITASPDFLTKNPKYFSEIFKKERTEKVPAYKALLENGTPLLDIIQTIKPYNMQGDKIVFMGGSNSLLAQDGALIVMDGIQRGTSASVLQSINPWDVDEIKVSTNPMDIQRYTGLNSVGLIEITLKKGEGMEEFADEKLPDDLDFETAQENETKKGGEDHRSTLMWDVENDISAGENYQIQYKHSDFISPVLMRMYFIPKDGIPLYFEEEYDVN